MIDTPELGYTPNNLKALRQKYKLTQQQVAGITEAALQTVQRWEMTTDRKSYINMPHTKWQMLLQYVANNPSSTQSVQKVA